MDLGTVLSAAQTLFAALQCKELDEICSLFCYKTKFNDLQRTVETVKASLRDIDDKQELSMKKKSGLRSSSRLSMMPMICSTSSSPRFSKSNLSRVVSSLKRCVSSFLVTILFGCLRYVSRVEKIRTKLDAIATNHAKHRLSADLQLINMRRREDSYSYVYKPHFVRRGDDVEKIVGHFLDESKQQVSFLCVVGIGGLGKTALAGLVFHDERVKSAFPLRLWTSVSDHDKKYLDLEQIFRKILSSDGRHPRDGVPLETLQQQLLEKLKSNKYLLVLDDIWNESPSEWTKLQEFLLGGYEGSRILVTTRSHETARIIGDGTTHELQGLSKQDSWCLFQKIAFKSVHSDPHDELVEIGEKIVEGCAGVPLAIRVVGSLLNGQPKSKWLSFQHIELFNTMETKKNIMSTLKLSYNQLESPLKSCFTYCWATVKRSRTH